jgi:hypothetical protein
MLENWARAAGFAAVLIVVFGGSVLWALLPQLPIYDNCDHGRYSNDAASNRLPSPVNQGLKGEPKSSDQKTANPQTSDSYRECQKLAAEIGLTHYTRRLVWVGVGTAIVLVFQSLFLGWTVYLTTGAINLARAEFVATHRPKITAGRFDVSFPLEEGGFPQAPVHFYIANEGEGRAFVTGVGTKIIHSDKQALEPNVEFIYQEITPPIQMKAGEFVLRMTVDKIRPGDLNFSDRGTMVVCVGYIKYKDGNGTLRQTGFCRMCNSATQRWIKIDDQDYEYTY